MPGKSQRRVVVRVPADVWTMVELSEARYLPKADTAPVSAAISVACYRSQSMTIRGMQGPADGGLQEVPVVTTPDDLGAFGAEPSVSHFNKLRAAGR